MGRRHIYNFEVVAKNVVTNWYVKDFQHAFRKYVPRTDSSQSTTSRSQLNNTGKQVKELLQPTPPISQVEFIFRESFKIDFLIISGVKPIVRMFVQKLRSNGSKSTWSILRFSTTKVTT